LKIFRLGYNSNNDLGLSSNLTVGNLMILDKLRISVALCFVACIGTIQIAKGADAVMPVDLSQVVIEGGAAAPAFMENVEVNYQGQDYQGIKLVMRHDKDARNGIRIPVTVNAKQYKSLTDQVNELSIGGERAISNFNKSTFAS
jgi:hypothetical protein